MGQPDLMLNLPRLREATAKKIQGALIETAKAMIEFGYDPASIAHALIGTGATLALDFGGKEYALTKLGSIADEVQRALDKPTAPPAVRT